MPKVSGVIPSAAAGTVAKTGYIDPATKNDYKFNFPAKNNQNNQKNSAAAGVPLIPTKRTRLEYSTVAKT
ncbi:hypothetical protein BB561_002696, partial [Smittium simulii]